MRRVSVSLLLLCLLQPLLASPIQAEEPDAKEASKAELKKSLRKIQIGKETTHIEGPLDAGGNVDYLAAINARLSDGVTPENNAVVELWMAAGPSYDSLVDIPRTPFFESLGIRRFPSHASYLVRWEDFALPKLDEEELSGAGEWEREMAERSALRRRLTIAQVRSWTDDQQPEVAKWLDRNAEALKHIEKAIERDRYYEPLQWDPRSLDIDPTSSIAFAAADLLVARTMRRLGSGDLQGAADDTRRLHRLAAMVCLAPTLEVYGYGCFIRKAACQATRIFAESPNVSSETLLALLAKIDDVPQDDMLLERYDYFERLIVLANIEQEIRKTLNTAYKGVKRENRDLTKVLDAAFGNSFMDWNEPLRISNRFFDQNTAAMRKPTLKEAYEALETANEEYNQFVTQRGESRSQSLLQQMFAQKSISKSLGREVARPILSGNFLPAEDYFRHHHESLRLLDLTIIVVAIAAFQRDNGGFPASLSSLTPRYLPRTPIDPENGLSYQLRMSVVSVGLDGLDDLTGPGNDDIEVHLRDLPGK